jgi:tetratricopeptide (TPR) repeat protein
MELVHGVPITKYCDDNHLTPRERLELFVPVCQAIQHAHQEGIIHRDIKPSNVMVTLYDGKPVPKVIDFGVAKATEQKLTERTLFTQYGTMVGTLEYMSPEQAEMSALGVDTRSDIYSLGVLLYELLTGSTPLTHKRMKEAAYAEILRMIKEEEPSKPSTRLSDSGEALASISANRHTEPAKLTKLVRGELDWIVMKTLEKDRNRRYETAIEFAQDVRRYLHDEPVAACPPSIVYRLRKFVRRNKRTLTTVGLTTVAVVALITIIGRPADDAAAWQALMEEEVSLAVEEAEVFHAQRKWPEALAAAKRAERLPLAGRKNHELRGHVPQLRRDVEMVQQLERIPLQGSQTKLDPLETHETNRQYAAAFRDYGIDIEVLSVQVAADRIRSHPRIALSLVAALDDWVSFRSETDEAGRQKLSKVALSADPNPWRQRIRDANLHQDWRALDVLATDKEAVAMAARSVQLFPKAGAFWTTLGVAHYRAGDANRAIEAVGKSMELRKGGDSFDWFFLAMSHWQLNEKDEARKWYDKAVEWMDKNKPEDEKRRRFRTEAEELLGINRKQ